MMLDTTTTDIIIEKIREESNRFHSLNLEVGKVIVGQHDIINFAIIAILCNGHILLEGVPGVAKTTLIKALTKALGLTFNRIQFTPDLLPADLIGTLMYNPKTQEFETKKGPIFANLILADEINRAPSKVQAALLEAMQEQQVTIGSHTFHLDKPFLVFATQNPIEQEGTYQLPEAQLDRFMFKLLVDYPNIQQEREILRRTLDTNAVGTILNKQEIFQAQQLVKDIYVDDKISDYIVNIVFATRTPAVFKLDEIKPLIQYGVSPRATLALSHAAKAHAFLKKRHFVTPDDVKAVAPAILRHRIILTYEAEAQEISVDHIIQKILNKIPTP
ncbi:MAG: MoxR family ATPase [Candidatus Dependentiae bacterium]|nr:MoxR family ATPase [Candidatus Dependentiae bacterium]